MAYDYDEPEYEDPSAVASAAAAAENGLTIKVTGYDATRVEELVVARLATDYRRDLDTRGKVETEKILGEALVEFVRDRLQVEAAKILEAGWTSTDTYGNPTNGGKLSLAQRVNAIIVQTDRYDSGRTWLTSLVQENIKSLLGDKFKAEMEEAKANFRKQVDELLVGKIAEGLRSALGLSR